MTYETAKRFASIIVSKLSQLALDKFLCSTVIGCDSPFKDVACLLL